MGNMVHTMYFFEKVKKQLGVERSCCYIPYFMNYQFQTYLLLACVLLFTSSIFVFGHHYPQPMYHYLQLSYFKTPNRIPLHNSFLHQSLKSLLCEGELLVSVRFQHLGIWSNLNLNYLLLSGESLYLFSITFFYCVTLSLLHGMHLMLG